MSIMCLIILETAGASSNLRYHLRPNSLRLHMRKPRHTQGLALSTQVVGSLKQNLVPWPGDQIAPTPSHFPKASLLWHAIHDASLCSGMLGSSCVIVKMLEYILSLQGLWWTWISLWPDLYHQTSCPQGSLLSAVWHTDFAPSLLSVSLCSL